MDYVCVPTVASELICGVVIAEPTFASVNFLREK